MAYARRTTTAVACRLTKSANQAAIAAGATAAVTFDGEAFDPSGLHDNATNNSRITNTTGATRKFLVGGACQFDIPRKALAFVRVDGTTAIPGGDRQDATAAGLILPPTIVELAANSYVEFMVTNQEGSLTVVVRGGTVGNEHVNASFWAEMIGD